MPTFADVQRVLNYLIGENPDWYQIARRHRNLHEGEVDPHLFGWETEAQLLNAKARDLWLINPEFRGNGMAGQTNLIRILTEDGLGIFPRMPLEGFGNRIERDSEECQVLVDWINSLPPPPQEFHAFTTTTNTTMSPDQRFLSLGDELPPIPTVPSGFNFVQVKRIGPLLYLSGMGPQWGATFKPEFIGKVWKDLTIEQGYAAARLTALNLLHVVRGAVKTLDAVKEIVEIFGMVNSAPDFKQFPKVINGCSDCLVEIFGEPGKHVRTAIGAELPFSIAVDINMTVRVE